MKFFKKQLKNEKKLNEIRKLNEILGNHVMYENEMKCKEMKLNAKK